MTDLLTENARLREVLAYYADQFCEGFCNDLPEAGTYHISMDDRCSGCKARAALATPATDASDLTDPVAVHANMLRGTIAKPTVEQIIHLYGSAVFLELLHKLGLCRPTTHDAQSGVYWCAACRNTNAIHCAHPDECGNMRRITRDEIAAQADSWKAWLDDLPLPEFKPAIDDLQDYLTIVVNALFTLNIEDEQPKPPAPDAVVDWLWYGEDAEGKTHVSLGRWQRHPCQSRYKLADIQPVEHDHPSPSHDAVQEAARVTEIAALIEAATALGVRAMVAGWNGEGREHPYTPHPSRLGATIKTTCGAVYALDAALRAIAGDST